MNFTHTKRIDWFGNFHCEKWLIGSVVMEIWWQNYWILLLFSNQMCKITHSQIRFLVPLFFKTINDFQALFKENFPFSRHIEKSSTFQDRIQIQALFKVCGNHGPVNSLFSQVECSFTTERIKMILYRLCQENRKIYGFFFQNFCGLIIQVPLYNIHIHYRKVAWLGTHCEIALRWIPPCLINSLQPSDAYMRLSKRHRFR